MYKVQKLTSLCFQHCVDVPLFWGLFQCIKTEITDKHRHASPWFQQIHKPKLPIRNRSLSLNLQSKTMHVETERVRIIQCKLFAEEPHKLTICHAQWSGYEIEVESTRIWWNHLMACCIKVFCLHSTLPCMCNGWQLELSIVLHYVCVILCLPVCLSMFVSDFLCLSMSLSLFLYLSVYLSVFVSCLSLSISGSVPPYFFGSVCLSLSLPLCYPFKEPILWLNSVNLTKV